MKYFDDIIYEDFLKILEIFVGGLKSSYYIVVKKIIVYLENNEIF